jgi:hypothetical protein
LVHVFQLRAGFFKDDGEGEAMWEKQHELRAQKVYSLSFELGRIFINVGVLCFLFFVLSSPSIASTLDRLSFS